MRALRDTDRMPFGHFKNVCLGDLDKRYLLALRTNILKIKFSERSSESNFIAGYVETNEDRINSCFRIEDYYTKKQLIDYAVEDAFKYSYREVEKRGFFMD